MKPSNCRKEWTSLIERGVTAEETGRLARQVAMSFMDRYFHGGDYEEEYIDLLCEMATFSDIPQISRCVAKALFGIIVEGLCDDFEEMHADIYNRVMIQVISFCRRLPVGRELDKRLDSFGIHSSDEFLVRMDMIRGNNKTLPPAKNIRKILLLSRVNIGADVAITSVVVQRLSSRFPNAEIVILGSEKLMEIYGGHPGLRVKDVHYNRNGGLIERLSHWHDVSEQIDQEMESFSSDACILIDPDSRLSQLGILPLVPYGQYFFFDSRSAGSFDNMMSMAGLTNRWLDTLLEKEEFHYPTVWLPKNLLEKASRLVQRLKQDGALHIIVMNLGVGGNDRKRVKGDFEIDLMIELLRQPHTVILLDRGFGDEELARTKTLIDSVSEKGFSVNYTSLDVCGPTGRIVDHGVVGIQCSIGEIASLIACGDEFIGYDSACQHIAAGLGVRTLTVFAGTNNIRFIRRWSACGRNKTAIVHVDTLSARCRQNSQDLVKHVMDARNDG